MAAIRKLSAVFLIFSFLILAGAAEKTLVPLGSTAGIRILSDGVVVVGVNPDSPAQRAGLCAGDVIYSVNGKRVFSNEELRDSVGAERLVLKTDSGEIVVTPQAEDNDYVIGAWVRDSLAGIGTLTYYDPSDGSFGALGHGICEGDTLIPFKDGELMSCEVVDIVKGMCGEPGELLGEYDDSRSFGRIHRNTDAGIFGKLTASPSTGVAIAVCPSDMVKTGEASIYANISGDETQEYKISILKLYSDGEDTRNMLIEVTDERLLERTGGIVRGMSGSPIIQDGRLVGAVTHVLVDEPEKGYGIFIENMIESAHT